MFNRDVVIELVKARMDRAGTSVPAPQISYWLNRIEAAAKNLESKGIVLTESIEDSIIIADYAVWQLTNRDKADAMPQWLRLVIRERWLRTEADDAAD